MKTKRVFLMLLMVGIVACGVVTQRVLASGTATASATAVGDGVNCGSISKPSGTNTGAMTVVGVTVNGETHAYTVTAGTNGSTRPRITFNPALKDGDKVVVTLSTIHEGEFKVNLALRKKKGDC